MRKNLKVAMMVLFLSILSVGTAFAYFSLIRKTPLGVFTTGSSQVEVTADLRSGSNLVPGDMQTFIYHIENVGTVPVVVKNSFETAWSDPSLSTANVQGVELVVNRGSGFETILSNPFSLAGEFFYSSSGDEDALWELNPGETWTVQVTAQLDEDAGEEYMLQEFSAEAVVFVKEVGESVPWPVAQ